MSAQKAQKVYAVIFDYGREGKEVESVWLSQDEAESRAAEMRDPSFGPWVEDWPVGVSLRDA